MIQGMFGLIYSNPRGLRKNCNEVIRMQEIKCHRK